jgi:5-methylcytosine-specific restriction endonuclease McrA
MTPILKACPRHGLYQPGNPPIRRGRCPECNREDSARRRQKWQHKIWTSAQWRRTRATVLARDGHRCTKCGRTDRLQAHHTLPISEHDPSTWFDTATIVTLCAYCHGPLDGARSQR